MKNNPYQPPQAKLDVPNLEKQPTSLIVLTAILLISMFVYRYVMAHEDYIFTSFFAGFGAGIITGFIYRVKSSNATKLLAGFFALMCLVFASHELKFISLTGLIDHILSVLPNVIIALVFGMLPVWLALVLGERVGVFFIHKLMLINNKIKSS